MDTNQWIIFVVVIAIAIYAFFEIANSFTPRKQIPGMLGLVMLMFVVAISLFLVFITADANKSLSIKNKAKCPEYVSIKNVYILKK